MPKTAVIFGDSLTEATDMPAEDRFVGLLAARFPAWAFVNQGRSGWSTGAYLRRWDEVAAVLPPDAALVIVQLGSNDLREYGHAADTLNGLVARMTDILRRVNDHCPVAARAIVAPPGMEIDRLSAPIRDAGFGALTNPLIAQIAERYRVLAQQLGVGFIDLSGCLGRDEPTDAAPLTSDGAHPTAAGHQQLFSHFECWFAEEHS